MDIPWSQHHTPDRRLISGATFPWFVLWFNCIDGRDLLSVLLQLDIVSSATCSWSCRAGSLLEREQSIVRGSDPPSGWEAINGTARELGR